MSLSNNIEFDHDDENHQPNIILDDYLDLIRCSYPHCNCGKCISKKLSHNAPNYKYNKNIGSIYKDEFNWKEKLKKEENENLNRNKVLLEKSLAKNKHLTDSLVSTMKKDYNKNSKNSNSDDHLVLNKNEKKCVSEYESNMINSMKGNNINEINDKKNRPFIGRSNYDSNFPDWHFSKNGKVQSEVKPREIIPFNGKSNYKEKFIRHENNYYSERRPMFINSPSLEVKGGDTMRKESTQRENLRPIDYENFRNINQTPPRRGNSIVYGPYSKNSFLSSYERAFMYNNLSARKERSSMSNFIY